MLGMCSLSSYTTNLYPLFSLVWVSTSSNHPCSLSPDSEVSVVMAVAPGSPCWVGDGYSSSPGPKGMCSLIPFVYTLKGILRTCSVVAKVTQQHTLQVESFSPVSHFHCDHLD